jgi:SLOG family YspA-like protein
MSRPLPTSTTATRAERLLVTGSRDWTDGLTIEAELARVRPALVIEGGARGADRLAAAAARRLGIEVLELPTDWQREGRRAGVLRNVQMLREGRPTQVLAFHDDLPASRGTAHMCRIAHQAGLLVTLVSHREDGAAGYLRRAPEAVLLLASLFHPWPADKCGGSDPDRCPECAQTNYRLALRWDGGA